MNIRAGNQSQPSGALRIRDTHFRIEGRGRAHAGCFCGRLAVHYRRSSDRPGMVSRTPDAGSLSRGHRGRTRRGTRPACAGTDRCARYGPIIASASPPRIFLPDPQLIAALNTAALRGVSVEILLPARNNLPFVHWACMAHLWQVLERGSRVWFVPGTFDHSKVMIVDGEWTFFGSSNWTRAACA